MSDHDVIPSGKSPDECTLTNARQPHHRNDDLFIILGHEWNTSTVQRMFFTMAGKYMEKFSALQGCWSVFLLRGKRSSFAGREQLFNVVVLSSNARRLSIAAFGKECDEFRATVA